MFKTRWLLALSLVLPRRSLRGGPRRFATGRGCSSAEAISQAQAKLDRVEREYHVPVTVETIESLNGRNIDDVLPERAKAIGAKGLFVLIAKKPPKLEVERTSDYARGVPARPTAYDPQCLRRGLEAERGPGFTRRCRSHRDRIGSRARRDGRGNPASGAPRGTRGPARPTCAGTASDVWPE